MFQSEYQILVGQWRRVCEQTIEESEKVAACGAILASFIERKVLLAMRSPNPAIRFYANMVSLEKSVRPYGFRQDDLVKLAIAPAHHVVRKWVDANTFPVRIATPTFANHLMTIP